MEEALSRASDGEPVLVRGALMMDDAYSQVWLCGRAEPSLDSGAPQCGGAILLVANESSGSGLSISQYIAELMEVAAVEELQQSGTIPLSANATFLGRFR